MIPGFPDLPSSRTTAEFENAATIGGTLEQHAPHLLGGDPATFDILIAAAVEPPVSKASPAILDIENPAEIAVEPDLGQLPGNPLPAIGSNMPNVDAVDSPPVIPERKQPELAVTPKAIGPDSALPPSASEPSRNAPPDGNERNQQRPERLSGDANDAQRNAVVAPATDRANVAPNLPNAAPLSDLDDTDPVRRLPTDTPVLARPLPARNLRSELPVTQHREPVTASIANKGGATAQVEPDLETAPPVRLGDQRGQRSPLAVQSQATIAPTADTAPLPQSQPAQAPANLAIQATAGAVSPVSEVRVETRVIPQMEQAIDALSDAREAGRTSRPEVLLRHTDFGIVSMRFETASGDLRANLASRDPGFVPAVQAALGERTVAASSETATAHNNARGQDHGQANNNSQSLAGNGGGSGSNYGSSPGSSQGSSQPRMAQQEAAHNGADEHDLMAPPEQPSQRASGRDVFA